MDYYSSLLVENTNNGYINEAGLAECVVDALKAKISAFVGVFHQHHTQI